MSTTEQLESRRVVAEQLYQALGRSDAEGIRQILSADFKGHITPGFPLDAGGDHAGADAMMERVWWAIGANFRARPVADEYRLLDDGRLFVRGHYLGQARGSGARLDAEFIHLLTFNGDRVTALDQLTDSAAWWAALGEPQPTPAN